jgi:hypothetical protein
MNTTTVLAIVAILAVGFIASSSSFIVSALAARGGGQSNNGCGLTGESGQATSGGRELGQGTSQTAQDLKASGSNEGQGLVSGGASGCRH